MNISIPLLAETAAHFKDARGSLLLGAKGLYEISNEKLYQGLYSNFGEYVEEACGISQGYASKLISVYTHFTLNNGVSLEKLAEIDYEKLNMARTLTGTVDEQIAKAQTLSRRELREEKNEEEPHTHEEIKICKICQIRLL